MDRLFYRLFDVETRLQPWLRPLYRGAVFIFGLLLGWQGKLFLLAIIGALIAQAGLLEGMRLLAKFLAIAIVSGAVGGIVSGIFEPLGRTGRLGEWFHWALTIFAYLATVSLLLPPVPLALPDPVFFWVAGVLSILGALALVLTDDRSRSRLPPHQFRLVRSLASLRVAPNRIWAMAEDRLERYESHRHALEAEIAIRPAARAELLELLRTMRTDIGHVRNGLERFVRLIGADPESLNEAEAWLDRIDEQMAIVEGASKGPE